ncbi:MAG: histidine phosphatase family protein [Ignavibacteriaceae bacterium]|nr:histidine phosphatase family protein [Ignavibacteriaceae bacterium]
MNIYLIRHSDAEKASVSKKDSERKLTAEGEQKIKTAAEGWKNLIPQFSHIISSPFSRALQTAEIIASVFKFPGNIIIDKRLISGNKTEEFIDASNEILGQEMAFVGHEPDFSEHLSQLISNSGVHVDFKKGMIAKISFNGRVKMGKGVLEFLIPVKAYK